MPDHPSWPAELVEKAAKALSRDDGRPEWHKLGDGGRAIYRSQAKAVLSALSGDLVPREEHERASEDVRLAEEALPAGNEAFAIVEARSQADALAEALEEAEKALREHAVTWIALSDRLDQPYPDDPRWSPWTRFAKRVLDRGDRARKRARSALASYRSSSSTETEG